MKKQNGFGALEGLLIIVIVGILGFTGWYVWHSAHSANSTYNAAGNTQLAATSKKKSSTSSSNNATTSANVLKIPELGIELTLPSALKDPIYAYDDGTKSGAAYIGAVDISTKTLLAIDKNCNTVTSNTSIGVITKYSGKFQSVGPENLLKQYATYYLAWVTPNGTACSSSTQYANEWSAEISAFETAVKTAQDLN